MGTAEDSRPLARSLFPPGPATLNQVIPLSQAAASIPMASGLVVGGRGDSRGTCSPGRSCCLPGCPRKVSQQSPEQVKLSQLHHNKDLSQFVFSDKSPGPPGASGSMDLGCFSCSLGSPLFCRFVFLKTSFYSFSYVLMFV